MPYPEPSINDHGAPYNWDEENDCCICTACKRERRQEDVDDYEYHYRRDNDE